MANVMDPKKMCAQTENNKYFPYGGMANTI